MKTAGQFAYKANIQTYPSFYSNSRGLCHHELPESQTTFSTAL